MKMIDYTVRNDEKIIFSLRSLYEMHGYSQYKMTKFEEYDLYVKNKDFLLGENIITFNDTNGKLMALKPDVTLSIIKNHIDNPDLSEKLYYNENVYRVSKGSRTFKEIMQVGIECIGNVDGYCLAEILTLAVQSLNIISDESVLCVSSLEIISQLIENVPSDIRKQIISFINEKNIHELTSLCRKSEIEEQTVNKLIALTSLHGKYSYVFPQLKKILADSAEVINFEKILSSLDNEILEKIEIDFSTAGDSKYYNGIAFKGYINGISDSVISGGQYDKLMKKMGRKSNAVGFAIYLDVLENLDNSFNDYDVDTVIIYDEKTDVCEIGKKVNELNENGQSVLAVKKIPEKIKYKNLCRMCEKEAEFNG